MSATALTFADLLGGYWLPSHRADPRAAALYRRHYSAVKNAKPWRRGANEIGPGEPMVLLTADCLAVFAWLRNTAPRWDGQTGICCTVFRNEGPTRSSDLIAEACDLAWQRWPDERLWTYVDATKIRSTNPGYCFIKAGWRRLRERSKERNLVILECLPSPAVRSEVA